MVQATRRGLLGGALALAATSSLAHAETSVADAGEEVIDLWPGTPPGGAGVHITPETVNRSHGASLPNRSMSGIATPRLIVRKPAKPNGSAIMAIPGGGYSHLAYDKGGEDIARWLAPLGVTTFILVYRLPGEGWAHRSRVPLQDAQRAMRLIRSQASRFAIDPDKLGILGFSAGGHLAGSLATMFDRRVYDPIDKADALSARPMLAGLLYPVIDMGPEAHVGSRDNLLGPSSTMAERTAWSIQDQVTQGTPPVFLCNNGDDPVVPPVNSLMMYQAMLQARRSAELHSFEKGGHGFGLRLPAKLPASHWPELFTTFARYHGMAI